MSTTIVHIKVKPEYKNAFIEATRRNRDASVQEPGNLAFDFLQHVHDPCYFVLYEAYNDEESAQAHKQTEHYLRWKEEVEPMMAEPRQGVSFDRL
ncbi:antibiotic biosynthesis monooxygenase [Halorhodospira halochloris]|uniref:antibiotic biosynthesis monooxygenase n=1 Tax=Halorhodospira halochloris TaxID=1052 RepID=UPI001EE87552|nr:antibiotic biosynthesis monooxygenase [Halorhodospira halochloris]MCG5531524.1 antibiotic biosynthesis monooxygenase [Halorhodospira halochloris]